MRLPSDAALIVIEGSAGADPAAEAVIAALVAAWREERLPVFAIRAGAAFAETERELEGIGATTLVVCGASVEATVRTAAGLGYRAFVVEDACWSAGGMRALAGMEAKVVDGATARAAARRARARERWKAARLGGV